MVLHRIDRARDPLAGWRWLQHQDPEDLPAVTQRPSLPLPFSPLAFLLFTHLVLFLVNHPPHHYHHPFSSSFSRCLKIISALQSLAFLLSWVHLRRRRPTGGHTSRWLCSKSRRHQAQPYCCLAKRPCLELASREWICLDNRQYFLHSLGPCPAIPIRAVGVLPRVAPLSYLQVLCECPSPYSS